MPFASKAQARWMFAKKPAMAKEWAAKTPSIKALPQHVKHMSGKHTDHSHPATHGALSRAGHAGY